LIKTNSTSFWIGITITIAAIIYISIVIGSTGAVELTKAEALHVQNLRFQAIAAQADLNDYVTLLQTKYQVNFATHNLELATGMNSIKPDSLTSTGYGRPTKAV